MTDADTEYTHFDYEALARQLSLPVICVRKDRKKLIEARLYDCDVDQHAVVRFSSTKELEEARPKHAIIAARSSADTPDIVETWIILPPPETTP